jgi:hypothetical protein
MRSSTKSNHNSDEVPQRWGEILGIFIAVLTLTLPIVAIANFSPSNLSSSLGNYEVTR